MSVSSTAASGCNARLWGPAQQSDTNEQRDDGGTHRVTHSSPKESNNEGFVENNLAIKPALLGGHIIFR